MYELSKPKKLDKPTGGVFFMKLTLDQKIQIYNEWKLGHRSPRFLAYKYQLNHQFTEYMVYLAE